MTQFATATFPHFHEMLSGQDLRIPLRDGTTRRPINLDHAASTPPLRAVRVTVERFLDWYSSVHRGTGFTSQLATQAYEEARTVVGRFVGARDRQHTVIFGPNTTWALNKLVRRMAFAPGDVVISTTLEHHANDLPWRQVANLVYARCDDQGRLDVAHVAELLQRYAGRARLLAITGGSNVTGHLPDVHYLAALAHDVGAQIVVDAAQLVPHRAIDIGDLRDPAHLDYIAFSGHKLYAPYGSGALVGRRDTFAAGAPDVVGGGTVRLVTPDHVEWAEAPARDEAGTPNVVGAVALAAAVLELERIGFAAIAAHEAALTARLLERLQCISGVQVYGDKSPASARQRLGVIPFAVADLDPRLVGAILSCDYGIAVRCGAFCAHPYVQHLIGQEAVCGSERPSGLIRASLGLATTAADIEDFAAALTAIVGGSHRGDYLFDGAAGAYYPHDWRPDVTTAFSLGVAAASSYA
jgi:cysteine desulfurase/selenocysteine lyase